MTDSISKFVKFGFVTILSFIINLWVSYLCNCLTINTLISKIISFTVTILHCFAWNYLFVFDDDTKEIWWLALIKTIVVFISTFILLNALLNWVWANIFHITTVELGGSIFITDSGETIQSGGQLVDLSPMLNLIILTIISFVACDKWAYKARL